jgi:PAS domain S-box-containing protein
VNELGVCELTNESLHISIGFADDELVGKHFSRLFPEEERSFYEDQWKQTGNRPDEFKGETAVITSTGDAVSSEISFVEIHTGLERKFVGFIFDKTNELAAERHYAEAKRREEELQQLKSRFISMVSNQLRAALVTVATNAELLERFVFKWSDEKRYRAFFRINETLKQMMDLLRDVEMTTHASSDLYKRSISSVNLEALVEAAVRDARTDTGCDHPFTLSEQGDTRAVSLDQHLTKTILYHLLSNAFKYSPDGNDVKVHVERNDTMCVFTVNDSGIGIPAEDQKNLFTSFFRASNAGNIHGSGLGLTIVRQYVQLAGGTISINSAVNKGTSVVVSLPIVAS